MGWSRAGVSRARRRVCYRGALDSANHASGNARRATLKYFNYVNSYLSCGTHVLHDSRASMYIIQELYYTKTPVRLKYLRPGELNVIAVGQYILRSRKIPVCLALLFHTFPLNPNASFPSYNRSQTPKSIL